MGIIEVPPVWLLEKEEVRNPHKALNTEIDMARGNSVQQKEGTSYVCKFRFSGTTF